ASTNHRRGIRADLAERFHHVYVPPLALRGDDIVALVEEYGKEHGVRWVTARFVEWAAVYTWPGNVRELKRYLDEAAISGVLDVPQVPLREMPEALYESIRRTKAQGLATLALADFGKAFQAHRPDPARIETDYTVSQRARKDSKKALLGRIAHELERMNTDRLFTRSFGPEWTPVRYAHGAQRSLSTKVRQSVIEFSVARALTNDSCQGLDGRSGGYLDLGWGSARRSWGFL
ncbi:MAG: hypothetical protein ACRDQ6_20600, partial [Pseudonocardiaceae bacterium]